MNLLEGSTPQQELRFQRVRGGLLTSLLLIMLLVPGIAVFLVLDAVRNQESVGILIGLTGRQQSLVHRHLAEVMDASRELEVDLESTRAELLDLFEALEHGRPGGAADQAPEIPAVPTARMRERLEQQGRLVGTLFGESDRLLELDPMDPLRLVRLSAVRALHETLQGELDGAVAEFQSHGRSMLRASLGWVAAASIVGILVWLGLVGQSVRVAALVGRAREEAAARERAMNSLDAVVRGAADGMITCDVAGRIQAFNPAAERILGRPGRGLTATSLPELMEEPFRGEYRQLISSSLRLGNPGLLCRTREVLARHGDGTPFEMELTLSEMREVDGLKFVGMVRDISERKQAERELARRTTEERLLHEATRMAVMTRTFENALERGLQILCEMTGSEMGHAWIPVDDSGALVSSGILFGGDPAGRRLLSEASSARRLAPGEELAGRAAAECAALQIRDLREEGGGFRSEPFARLGIRGMLALPVVVGEQVAAVLELFSLEPMLVDARLLMQIGSVSEQVGRVLERRRSQEVLLAAKEQAEAASKSKSRFLANMSHELRTPLNSVIGFSNLLLKNKDGRLGEAEIDKLRRIRDNGKHLHALIDDVLDISKVEAGRMEFELVPVDLERAISDVLADLEDVARERSISLEVELPEGLAPIRADRKRFRQVLVNLVGNAIKFTSDGVVGVRVTRVPDSDRPDRIEVTDSGIGIAQHQLDTVFEAFQQGDSSPTKRFRGTGLGLTISRTICREMGFDLIAESQLGRGSRFTILLRPQASG